ncbi:MAG: hypothetical protein K0S32_539 [Bacteroidetes bacterium]|nr:hypothetical protein [Bacteroidota bacterium]
MRIGSVFLRTRLRKIGNESPAIIEESDTMRHDKSTMRKTESERQHETGKIQITIPKMVATPFPPLNPANTGKM